MDREPESQALQGAFAAALERDAEERRAFLADLAARDPVLAAEVRSLLGAYEGASEGYLTPSDVWGSDERGTDSGDLVGRRIGSFELTRVIGSGGMGVVYEAIQERPRRRVALKVMRHAVGGESNKKRFEFEAETLARLRHGAIAQIFESGTHEENGEAIPWFAMEFVEGALPITDHARSAGLGVSQRLALFTRVCEAVQHGHQKGVIHRDIKPGNVLVDSEGSPKIIDFGVACSTDADVSLTTVETDVGRIVGTLATMSPEQCAGDARDIDTRTDVYSLGVLLYELLSGHQPHALDGKAVVEAIQIIREKEPKRLGAVDASLAGDLETIVGKALEKDRDRRYPTAAGLARDVGHFLAHEPIEARPPSSVYRLRMLARRHRTAAAAVVLLAVVLVVGVVTTSWGWSEALAARDDADRDANTTRALNDFLLDIVRAPDPYSVSASTGELGSKDVRLIDALEVTARRIGEVFGDDPETELTLRKVFAKTYRHLGRLEGAREHIDRALELSLSLDGEASDRRLAILNERAAVLMAGEELEEGERILSEVYARLMERPDSELLAVQVGVSLAFAWRRQGRLDEAQDLYERLLERAGELLPEDDFTVLDIQNNLGRVYDERGWYERAAELHEDTLEKRRRRWGDDHPEALVSLNNLALAYDRMGHMDSAEKLYRASLEAHVRVLGEHHGNTLTVMSNLGHVLIEQQDWAEGEEYVRRAFDGRRVALGETHQDTLDSRSNLAYILLTRGKLDEGTRELEQLVDDAREAYSPDDWHLALYRVNLGNAYFAKGELGLAEELLADAHAVLDAKLGPEHPHTKTARASLATLFEESGRVEEGRKLR